MEELSMSLVMERRQSGEKTREKEVAEMLEYIAEGGMQTSGYALSRTEITKGEERKISFRVTKPSNVLFFRRYEIPGLTPGDILTFFFAVHEGKKTLKRILYRRKENREYVREGWVNYNAALEPVLKSVSMNTDDVLNPVFSFVEFFSEQYATHIARRLFIRSAALLVGGAVLAKYGGDFFAKYFVGTSTETIPLQLPDQHETDSNEQKTEEKIEVGEKNFAEFFAGDFIDSCMARRQERIAKEKGFTDRVDSEILHKRTINTLYVGMDATRERNKEGEFTNYEKYGIGNADVLMLICFDPQTFKTTQISLPRDLFFPEVAKQFSNKHSLNQVTAGVEMEDLLRRTVESATGVPIDAVVRTNIDAMQGTPESGYTNGAFDSLFPDGLEIDIQEDLLYENYPLGYGVEKVEFKKGKRKLKGHDLTKFSRCREPTKSDFGRNYRQQQVVSAAKRELGKRLVQEFALGQSTTLDALIRFLDDQINSKRNMSSDVTVLPVLQDVRTKLVEIRSKPIEGMIALASLVNNSKVAIDSLLSGNSSSSFTPNTGNILTETDGVLSFKESNKQAPPNKNGDFTEYWKPMRRKVKEVFSSTAVSLPSDSESEEAIKKKRRAEEIKKVEEKIKTNELVKQECSSFMAVNEKDESVGVNGEKYFETWSLIKLPLMILYIESRGGIDKVSRNDKEQLKNMVLNSEDAYVYIFENYTRKFGAGANPSLWEQGGRLIISECKKRFGLKDGLDFNSQMGLFTITGNSVISILESTMKLPISEREFILSSLSVQGDWGAKLKSVRNTVSSAKSLRSFHKVGISNNVDGRNSSLHEMGGFMDNTGKYVLYVTLNEFDKTNISPNDVDSFSSDALSGAVEVLV